MIDRALFMIKDDNDIYYLTIGLLDTQLSNKRQSIIKRSNIPIRYPTKPRKNWAIFVSRVITILSIKDAGTIQNLGTYYSNSQIERTWFIDQIPRGTNHSAKLFIRAFHKLTSELFKQKQGVILIQMTKDIWTERGQTILWVNHFRKIVFYSGALCEGSTHTDSR